MPRRHRTGLSRLTRYLRGRRAWVAVLMLAAAGEAAAQTGGWILVRYAINKGIVGHDQGFLTHIVVV